MSTPASTYVQGIEPQTKLLANAATTLANNGTIALTGTPPDATYLRRKAVLVTNLDAASNLQLLDAAGNVGLTILPTTPVILPISESCTVKNVSGGTISLSVAEIWWLA